jgi:hypothetical protein
MVPAGQVVPHAPQLALSVARFAQIEPHTVWPAGQETSHLPITQA